MGAAIAQAPGRKDDHGPGDQIQDVNGGERRSETRVLSPEPYQSSYVAAKRQEWNDDPKRPIKSLCGLAVRNQVQHGSPGSTPLPGKAFRAKAQVCRSPALDEKR